MTETIAEYFRRFDNSITESVYSTITIDDYLRNKAASQYLDYDRDTIFRKNKLYCGIRNIDNSCYLSTTLQILYNIQWLRERIFRVAEPDLTDFIRELQKLFALMCKGTLIYADPTDLFAVLKNLYPDLFVPGTQNDFHEVFTIVLDQLEKSLSSEDDKKFFRKLFYGKMKVQLLDEKGKVSSINQPSNSFNLINLASSHKSFDNALKSFKSEIIDGYTNQQGLKIKASKEVNFVETPAILSFFINRVSFVDKKVVKDNCAFDFEEKIMFAKTNSSKLNKGNDAQIEKQIIQLRKWIEDIKEKKEFLGKTLAYLEGEQFTNINIPNVQNPLGEQGKNNTIKFLNLELQGIEKQILRTSNQILELQKKRIKDAEQNYTELYNLWAVMIHTGPTADSGHYKMCIKIDPLKNLWIQLNDRRTEEISQQKIIQYKKRGQICCLFYKRNSLVSQPEKAQIPSSLKKYVQDEEQKLFKKIDYARVLQALYQQFQSANIIWQFQNTSLRQQEKFSTYFFKPLLHLIMSNTPVQTCKGYILYEMIQQPKFIESIKNKFIDPTREIKVPKLDFGIPSQYESISQALKQFLCLQLYNPIEAYTFISFYIDVTIKNPITNEYFNMLREVIILKGIFYEDLFVEINMLPSYEEMSKTIDNMLKVIGYESKFALNILLIRSIIHQNYISKIVESSASEAKVGILRQNASLTPSLVTPALFCKRFGFWIEQRKKMNLDQSTLKGYKKFHDHYAI